MNGRYLCACICARGKDIAAVLGAKTRGDGCIKGNGVAVSWGGGGHLLKTAPPDAYGERLKNWSLTYLQSCLRNGKCSSSRKQPISSRSSSNYSSRPPSS